MSVLADLSRRTKVIAILGLAGVVAGAAALGFAPLVRARVAAVAERRGLRVGIGRVRPGLAGIWLSDVVLGVPQIPGAQARIDSLYVGFGWRFNVSTLALHGARVEIEGEAAELKRRWEEYRSARVGAAGPTEAVRYLADGVDVVWRARAGAAPQRVWGLRYSREQNRERLALDLLRAQDSNVEIELRRPRATLRRALASEQSNEAALRQVENLEADGLEVSWLRAPEPGANGRLPAQDRGHFQPEPLRGPSLRAALAELSVLSGHSLPDGAGLNLEGVSLHFRQGTNTLNFGPSALRVVRLGAQIDLSLAPKAEASGTPLEFKLTLPIGPGVVRAELRGGPVSLRSLGVHEGDFGLAEVQAATVEASADVTLAADGSRLAFSGKGTLDHVSLLRPELAPAPLKGMRLGFRARGASSLDLAELTLDEAELSLGDVRVLGSGSLVRSERTLVTHWAGGVPLASCQALLDATPRGLAPLIASLRMSGTFGVKASLDYDSERPALTRVRLNVENDCRIDQIPAELSPRRFASYWRRVVKGADKQPLELESGPGSPDWVPIDAISPFMETAVLVCEDGHFPNHRGFDFEAIENSIKDNLIKGRFARGASTISMQLAKNLYLGKEKTLGRKLQEAVLTQLLEQELDKRELMELYLNVIEYAPGIYGIGPAAHYYFAKRASDLSLGQALYIASILPNPEHQHFDRDGKVSLAWTRYLQRLMRVAKKIGRVTDEQLATGLTEQVAFHVADSGGAPPSGGPALEEGSETPSELSP